MSDALDATFYIFGKWITYLFTDMNFNFGGYNASFGWLIIASTVISMIIASILNIPRTLPREAFYSADGRFQRDTRRLQYRMHVGKYARYKESGGNF